MKSNIFSNYLHAVALAAPLTAIMRLTYHNKYNYFCHDKTNCYILTKYRDTTNMFLPHNYGLSLVKTHIV
ncbi:hypothetical protein EV200_10778 [Pedobacter psychrotolerans]|uniref:Uncharacterized protein n=1 Tax=Pedobacter psychrotolerans TaxID=1843235 RepID=A0A4R2H630_9SPHI|nr:hypothetical protein EV200_10778 [Pedobacter psychrotolerans]